MGVAVFPIIALPLAGELDVDPLFIGYQMSIIYGAATFGAPWLSLLAMRWGACRGTQIALSFSMLGCLLAFLPAFGALVVASVLLGFAITMMTPTSVHLLMRYTPPENRSLLFSLKQTGVPLAWALMAVIAPPITQQYGWRWSLAVVIAVGLGIALALQRVRARWDDDRHAPAVRHSGALEGLALVWRHPVLRNMSLAAFCLSFVQLCLGTFLVTALVTERGYSLVVAGIMLSITQIAGVAGRILWGWLADRTGSTLTLLRNLSFVSMLCCPIMALVTPGWPLYALAAYFFVFGLTAVGWNGVYLAEIARRSPPGRAGVITGGAAAWTYGGILVGPAVFATVCRAVESYATTYVLLGIVALVGTLLTALASADARREEAAAGRA